MGKTLITVCLVFVLAFVAMGHKINMQRNHIPMHSMQATAQTRALTMHMKAHKAGLQPKGAIVGPKKSTPFAPMDNVLSSGMYVANISVGTPKQHFTVVMDTGSSNLWVPDSTCTNYKTSPSCAIQRKYKNETSSTFVSKCELLTCELMLPYGSGTVYGKLSMDTVEVGGLSLPKTTFGRVYAEPGPLSEWGAPVFDGILGLAYPIIAMPMFEFLPGPFGEMMKRDLVPQPLFSVHLSSKENDTSSYVAFGDIPTDNYEGNLTTVPQDKMQGELGYWCVSVTGIKVAGKVQPKTDNIIGVIDTGTSLIAGPPDVVNPIIAQVNATSDCSNVKSLPTLSFTFALEGGATKDFQLTPEQYTYRVSFKDGRPDECQCGLFAFDAGEGILPLWILGDPFIRSYFSVFNRGTNKLQFAPTKY